MILFQLAFDLSRQETKVKVPFALFSLHPVLRFLSPVTMNGEGWRLTGWMNGWVEEVTG